MISVDFLTLYNFFDHPLADNCRFVINLLYIHSLVGSSVCGLPQRFESGFGLWKNTDDSDYDFILYSEISSEKVKYAPSVDATGNKYGKLNFIF